jgi:hypothetical protein
VPSRPSRLKRVGVDLYKEISTRRWLFKLGTRLAMMAHVDQFVGRTLSTPVPKYPDFPFGSWLNLARKDIAAPYAEPVVSFPGQLKRKRFYVNFLSPEGQSLAFAKVSLDVHDDQCLLREARALRHLAQQPLRSFRVPKVLAEGTFDSHRYLITEAMPTDAKPLPATWRDIPQACRNELAMLSVHVKAIRDLNWWTLFRSKAHELKSLDEAIHRYSNQLAEVCWAHGDFTTRNICSGGNDVWIFDWENSSPDAPVLTDEVRFFIGMHGRRTASKPAEVATALGRNFVDGKDTSAKQNFALALAFLSTCTKSGVICARHWNIIESVPAYRG